LRLLAFCDYFSPDSSGGSERAAWEVYRRLASGGVRVSVVTTLPRGFKPYPDEANLQVHAVRLWDAGRALGVQAGVAPALLHAVPALAPSFKPDVLHANTLFFQTSLAAAGLQLTSRLPLVTTVQIAGLGLLPLPARLPAMAYEQTLGRFVISRSSQLIAVSESVRQHLLALGVSNTKILVAPNGVDLAHFHPRPPARTGTGSPLIAFVGRLIPNKGPAVFLEALMRLRQQNVAFTAVYFGDGPMRQELEQRSQSLRLPVEFRGHLRDVSSGLREADVLVRPSLTEGLPLAVLEAMASGVPVIASDIDGNRDVVETGVNGLLVAVNRPDALAAAIEGLLSNPAQRRAFAAAGRQTAQRFSWDRAAAATRAALESTTASSSSPTSRRVA
jgi:glycosyltransferase involved in cell wall biosynthesis